jgi:aspartate kinase
VVVVVSARGDTTDRLLRTASAVGNTVASREVDQLLAIGECESAALLALALNRRRIRAASLTGGQAGLRTTGPHGAGNVDRVRANRIRRLLSTGHVVVVAGFQAVNRADDIVTLGRGGSDDSAVAIAAALGAPRCRICTDVAGVCTADPRLVPEARVIAEIPADAMRELAVAGARVLHPGSVERARRSGLDIEVAHADSDRPGTVVGSRPIGSPQRWCPIAVAHDDDIVHVRIATGYAEDRLSRNLSRFLAERAVPVDLMGDDARVRASGLGFTLRRSDAARVATSLEGFVAGHGGRLIVDEAAATVSLVATGLADRPGTTGEVLGCLGSVGIAWTWVAVNRLRVSVVVPASDAERAVRTLHRHFGLGPVPRLAVGPEPGGAR